MLHSIMLDADDISRKRGVCHTVLSSRCGNGGTVLKAKAERRWAGIFVGFYEVVARYLIYKLQKLPALRIEREGDHIVFKMIA